MGSIIIHMANTYTSISDIFVYSGIAVSSTFDDELKLSERIQRKCK